MEGKDGCVSDSVEAEVEFDIGTKKDDKHTVKTETSGVAVKMGTQIVDNQNISVVNMEIQTDCEILKEDADLVMRNEIIPNINSPKPAQLTDTQSTPTHTPDFPLPAFPSHTPTASASSVQPHFTQIVETENALTSAYSNSKTFTRATEEAVNAAALGENCWKDTDGFQDNNDFQFGDDGDDDFEWADVDTPVSKEQLGIIADRNATLNHLSRCGFLSLPDENCESLPEDVHIIEQALDEELNGIVGVQDEHCIPSEERSTESVQSSSQKHITRLADESQFRLLMDTAERDRKDEMRLSVDRNRRAFHLRMLYMAVGGTEGKNARVRQPEDSNETVLSSLMRMELMAERHKGVQSKFDEMVKKKKHIATLREDAVLFMKQMERMDEILKQEESELAEQNRIIELESLERAAHPELISDQDLHTQTHPAILEDAFTKKMKEEGGLLVLNGSTETMVTYNQLPTPVGVNDLFSTMRAITPSTVSQLKSRPVSDVNSKPDSSSPSSLSQNMDNVDVSDKVDASINFVHPAKDAG
eukprot:CFRG6405T1